MEEEDLGIVLSEDEELGLEIAPEAVVVAETSNDVKPETLAGLPKVDAGKVALSLDATFDCGPVPSLCKGTPCCLGVDEAGRGPVIGPMIFGAAYWPLDQSDSINKLGFNDSKQLTESDRERMFGIIDRESDKIGHVLCTLSAEHISTNMMARNPVSLNELSYLATTGMIRRVVKSGVNVAEIYVDAVGNCERYQQRLSRDFPNACVTVKPKADAIYKVVGAASIYAKVTRDRSLKSWVFREQYASDGTPLAKARALQPLNCSGYPGDEKTVRWLQENANPIFGFPCIVRHSWKTTRNLLGECDDELEESERKILRAKRAASNSPAFFAVEWERQEEESFAPKLANFMAAKKRSKYFQEKRMNHVHSF